MIISYSQWFTYWGIPEIKTRMFTGPTMSSTGAKYRAGWLAVSSVWDLSTAVAGSATLASPVLMRAGSIEFANHIV